MKSFKVVVIFVSVFFMLTFKSAATEIITNETIITMVNAGLGEELIISKIQASQTQFDVSTETILKLKKEGVSEKIIKTMLEATTKPNTKTSDPKTAQIADPMSSFLGLPSTTTEDASRLYVKNSDKVREMLPITAEYAHSMKKHAIPFYFGPGDTWLYIRGEKSVVRLTEKKPVFYTKMNPSSFLLLKLAYHPDKNIRYAVSTGGVYKNTLPLKVNKKSEDFFELYPDEELALGEYAIISSMTFYDFGIE